METPWLLCLIVVMILASNTLASQQAKHRFDLHGEEAKEFIQHNIQDLDPTHSAFQLQDTAAIKDTDQSAYWFNFVDTDGNGALCGNELMASLSEGGRLSMQELLMHVDEILELDDHDGDGLISFKEFQESEAY